MKKIFNYGLATVGIAVLLTSCSGNKLADKENLLAGPEGKSWRITKIVAGNQDFTRYIPKSDLDNVTTFYSNQQYKMDEGASKANANAPQIADAGTWTLSKDRKKLTIQTKDEIMNWDVIELNEKEFKISSIESGFSNEVTYCLK
jgi:hypothetical protein